MAWGLVILSVMAVGKLLWGVVGGGIGRATTVPALTGLLSGNADLIYVVVRRQRARTGIGGGWYRVMPGFVVGGCQPSRSWRFSWLDESRS